MSDIPRFWKDAPSAVIPVEEHWQKFVRIVGGAVLEDVLPQPRSFENADFLFMQDQIVAELKEIETEFSHSAAFGKGLHELMQKLKQKEPDWRPDFEVEEMPIPGWFRAEFVRIFRPPLSRVLKKANRQIRDTKEHFGIQGPNGILLLVNDGFRSVSPALIRSQVSELLQHSYSSIDCCIYMTVNRYVEVGGSREPKLLWLPAYSDRAPDSLVSFVNTLGSRWFQYLENEIGPFTSSVVLPDATVADELLRGSKYVVLPHERGG